MKNKAAIQEEEKKEDKVKEEKEGRFLGISW